MEKATLQKGKLFFALFATAATLFPNTALAQVVITEIMYDLQNGADGGREWVEVYNTGDAAVPLGTWKLFENGTSHKITAISDGGMLAAGSYAVIADNAEKFKTDWPQFTGQLFDSTFSLSNSGEAIALRNASSTDIDAVSYQSSGAAGDGNSLNRTSGGASFVSRSPTPGAALSAVALAPLPPKEPAAKVAPKPKKSAATKSVAAPSTKDIDVPPEMQPEGVVPESKKASTHVSSAIAAPNSSWVWWLGVLAIAAFAGAAIFLAKRFGKREWDIEEM